jgi:hypothetical protein
VPFLQNIVIYPIKSLNGVAVSKATILKSGALQHDRQYAIFDQQDRLVNGKGNPKIHLLKTSYDVSLKTVFLQVKGSEEIQGFAIDEERVGLEAWLSNYFGFAVKLRENPVVGFPDDTDSPGPTIIGVETVETVASWFSNISGDEMRSRLRTNLEIADSPPFWEDQLFAQSDEIVDFKIGDVLFCGINPCQRCVVPTRDSVTGDVYPQFQKIFATSRQQNLPAWAPVSRFNHFFRVSVNTRIPESEAGKILQVEDEVKILSVSKLGY